MQGHRVHHPVSVPPLVMKLNVCFLGKAFEQRHASERIASRFMSQVIKGRLSWVTFCGENMS